MKRMHIHVGVKNLKESISFYSKMFATAPTIEKTDYAKDTHAHFEFSANPYRRYTDGTGYSGDRKTRDGA